MVTAAGLFSGVGALELGLSQAGFETKFLCEIFEPARRVLAKHFPDVEIAADVNTLKELPKVDVLSAGFPCQDLSQAGLTQGISGPKSGLVENIFRLLRKSSEPPRWLILENVPFMLHLRGGVAMDYLTVNLDELGYRWAYRVIDTRAFGLPQRRRRVIVLASQTEDPAPILLGMDSPAPEFRADSEAAGFYWTEGNTGLGWTDDGVPTLKSGSTIGIPSPPAIWLRKERRIVTPDIRDAERLQGLPPDWTLPALAPGTRKGVRWSLVGNAVSVPVFQWLGDRLKSPPNHPFNVLDKKPIQPAKWPTAGWGTTGSKFAADVSEYPCQHHYTSLIDFLQFPYVPLSHRAALGFARRAEASQLRFPKEFLCDVRHHISTVLPNVPSRQSQAVIGST